jgi:hypothetical protein
MFVPPCVSRPLCNACATIALSATLLAQAPHTPGSGARDGRGRAAAGAPEVDPGLAAAGLFVLIGGTLLLTGRRRPATR